MDRLTRKEIEDLAVEFDPDNNFCFRRGSKWIPLADALSALSQEAVRDEALDDIGQTRNRVGSIFLEAVEKTVFPDNLAIALCSYFERHIDRPENDPQTEHGWGEWAEQKTNEALDLIIRALKREPNAAGWNEKGIADIGVLPGEVDATAEPAPAAPDVAEVLSDWRVVAEFFASRNWPDTKLGDAASRLHARLPTLLAKLGQGWIPVSERLPEGDGQVLVTYNTGGADVLTRQAVRNLYEAAEIEGDGECFITHWMPLPPASWSLR